MTGYLDANGDPYLEIEIANPLGWKSKLQCLIDTGFTGFLSVPILEAFPIGLLLVGTMPVTLADGSVQYKLMCLGSAGVGAEAKVGVVLIEPGSKQALLGMEFLRQFQKRLVIDPIAKTVVLQDSVAS
jgi:predicted aspartyl protease